MEVLLIVPHYYKRPNNHKEQPYCQSNQKMSLLKEPRTVGMATEK